MGKHRVARLRLLRLFLGVNCLFLLPFAQASISAQAPPANYDEAQVGQVELPDLLKLLNGNPVLGASDWRKLRRPEIIRLFETNVYGRSPKPPRRTPFIVTSLDTHALGGLATRKEVSVYLSGRKQGPMMNLLLYLPNQRKGRVPVFLGMNFNGNQSISFDPGIKLASTWLMETRTNGAVNHRATEKSRGVESRRWPLEMILKRGYGIATSFYGDLFPDHLEGRKDSIVAYYSPNDKQINSQANEWGAISAWAWGLSRALDYLEQDADVDGGKIAVWGHSRLGKAALWAGALDERFALVISNESGEGGAALARRNFGETVETINKVFPYWFAGNYQKFSHDVNALPVDQHMLIALIAPRPVYVASAADDLWSDPRGEFLSLRGASPVYELFGKKSLLHAEMPDVNSPLMTTLGYHLRTGKHDVTTYDWEQFLNFADAHFRRP